MPLWCEYRVNEDVYDAWFTRVARGIGKTDDRLDTATPQDAQPWSARHGDITSRLDHPGRPGRAEVATHAGSYKKVN